MTAQVNTLQHDDWISIGKIVKPRGLQGEVKVLSLTDLPDRFDQLEQVNIRCAQKTVTLTIEQVRYHQGAVYLVFAGRYSREAIEDLIGGEIQVMQSSAPELPAGVYYHFEILGARVLTDDGRYLGTLADILRTGAHDVYVVQGERREYLIPATDEIVRQIDREQRTITIHPLKGLLDL